MQFTARPDGNFYADYRLQVIGNESYAARIYHPDDHVPTIGYGYTFVRNGNEIAASGDLLMGEGGHDTMFTAVIRV